MSGSQPDRYLTNLDRGSPAQTPHRSPHALNGPHTETQFSVSVWLAGRPGAASRALTGCEITGVELYAEAVATANRIAVEAGLEPRARFVQADASAPLPFEDGGFDAILCVDAINHLTDRQRVLTDWARLLTAGGRLLFTDPLIVTGMLDSDEIARKLKPSDGLEPSTPSLPFRCARNYRQSAARDSACLSDFATVRICRHSSPVAPALLHKCSIVGRHGQRVSERGAPAHTFSREHSGAFSGPQW